PGDPALTAVAGTVTSSLGAHVTIAADGTFTYDATGVAAVQSLGDGETATDTFTYQAADGFGGVTPAPVTVTVQGRNDAPVALDDTFTGVSAGHVLVVAAPGVLANDHDPDHGDQVILDVTASDATSAGGARVTLRPDGSFDYDPTSAFAWLDEGQTYADRFSYTVVDSHGVTSRATVHITLVGVNSPPVAPDYNVSSGFWTVPGQKLTVSAANGVLSKATDPNQGETVHLTAVGPANGLSTYGAQVTVHPDGSFEYDPTSSTALQNLIASGSDVVDTFK